MHFSHLDAKDPHHVKDKTKTFSTVYQKLTGKAATFEFPVAEL